MREHTLSRLSAALLVGLAFLCGAAADAHLLAARGGLVDILREADALVVAKAAGASQDRVEAKTQDRVEAKTRDPVDGKTQDPVDAATQHRTLATDFTLARTLSAREGTLTPTRFRLVAARQSPRYAAGEVALIAWKEISPARTADGVVRGIGTPADALRLSPEEATDDLIPALAALHAALLAAHEDDPAAVQQALWRIIELDSPRYSRAAALDLIAACHDAPVSAELAAEIRARRERTDLAPGVALLLRRVPVGDS